MSCGTETIDPKSEVPFHLHTDEEEILFCTKGKGIINKSHINKKNLKKQIYAYFFLKKQK